MNDTLRDHSLPMLGSALLHAALAIALILVARISFNRSVPPALGPSIDAVAVDSQLLRKAAEAREQQRRRAEEQQRALQQQRAEEQRREDEAKQAAEAQKQAAQRAAAEQQATTLKAQQLAAQRVAAKVAADKAAAAQTIARQQAAAAAAQKQRADEAQAAADQKAREQRETELRRQMADEERLRALQSGPQQANYIASIQNRITRAWLRPESARLGLVCKIQVTQIPGGEVTSAHVTDCNGDEAVRQSVENAVYRASPLPEPPDPALFQRNLTLVFKPNE